MYFNIFEVIINLLSSSVANDVNADISSRLLALSESFFYMLTLFERPTRILETWTCPASMLDSSSGFCLAPVSCK
jgi:hypothetical protein